MILFDLQVTTWSECFDGGIRSLRFVQWAPLISLSFSGKPSWRLSYRLQMVPPTLPYKAVRSDDFQGSNRIATQMFMTCPAILCLCWFGCHSRAPVVQVFVSRRHVHSLLVPLQLYNHHSTVGFSRLRCLRGVVRIMLLLNDLMNFIFLQISHPIQDGLSTSDRSRMNLFFPG